jgi:exodeoxyribonuclease VII small subunit
MQSMSSSATPASKGPEMSFEQALTSLQDIVAQLEGGALTLEETIAVFRQGSELASRCHQMIADAELRITKLAEPAEDERSNPDTSHPPRQLPGL